MSEIFQLPDGTKVGTGNLINPQGPANLFAPFPEELLWDDGQIRKALEERNYKKMRQHHGQWLINQGQIGKCNASAGVAATHQVRDLWGHPHVPLSDNFLYWNINEGMDRGSLLHHAEAFLTQAGCSPKILEAGTIPEDAYNIRQLNRRLLEEANKNAYRFKIHEPYQIPTDYEMFRRVVATCLAKGFPVIMAWDVTSGSMRLDSRGYAISGGGMGNHASFFHAAKWVGGRDLVHPDLQNSWGPTQARLYGPPTPGWGERGYGLMTMEQAFTCRRYHDFYVVTGVTQDPLGF